MKTTNKNKTNKYKESLKTKIRKIEYAIKIGRADALRSPQMLNAVFDTLERRFSELHKDLLTHPVIGTLIDVKDQ